MSYSFYYGKNFNPCFFNAVILTLINLLIFGKSQCRILCRYISYYSQYLFI